MSEVPAGVSSAQPSCRRSSFADVVSKACPRLQPASSPTCSKQTDGASMGSVGSVFKRKKKKKVFFF